MNKLSIYLILSNKEPWNFGSPNVSWLDKCTGIELMGISVNMVKMVNHQEIMHKTICLYCTGILCTT